MAKRVFLEGGPFHGAFLPYDHNADSGQIEVFVVNRRRAPVTKEFIYQYDEAKNKLCFIKRGECYE